MKYMIVIKKEPHGQYQPYKGWDSIYTSQASAREALARARAIFHAAKIVTAPSRGNLTR